MALTLAQWATDQGRRDKLSRLIQEPVFREAVETLSKVFAESAPEIIGTNSQAEPPDAANFNILLALRYSHRTGFFGAFQALAHLTKERPLRVAKQVLPTLIPEDEPRKKQPKP